jgi:hypothetical protein
MMSAASEGEERLAEILREILAMSGTKQPDHSKSAGVDDSIKLSDTQSASGIHLTRAPNRKGASEKRSKPEDQDRNG